MLAAARETFVVRGASVSIVPRGVRGMSAALDAPARSVRRGVRETTVSCSSSA